MRNMKKILAGVFLLILATAGIAIAAQQYYWRCKYCDEVVVRDRKPAGGNCPARDQRRPTWEREHVWGIDGRAN